MFLLNIVETRHRLIFYESLSSQEFNPLVRIDLVPNIGQKATRVRPSELTHNYWLSTLTSPFINRFTSGHYHWNNVSIGVLPTEIIFRLRRCAIGVRFRLAWQIRTDSARI